MSFRPAWAQNNNKTPHTWPVESPPKSVITQLSNYQRHLICSGHDIWKTITLVLRSYKAASVEFSRSHLQERKRHVDLSTVLSVLRNWSLLPPRPQQRLFVLFFNLSGLFSINPTTLSWKIITFSPPNLWFLHPWIKADIELSQNNDQNAGHGGAFLWSQGQKDHKF
jgi:hypothetical protein